MFANATVKGTIDTIPEIPGLAVWHEGHIGIYIGNGEAWTQVQADSACGMEQSLILGGGSGIY